MLYLVDPLITYLIISILQWAKAGPTSPTKSSRSPSVPHLPSTELNFLDMAIHPELSLEETMHAHEINDPKIDPKFDIQQDYTIEKMIEQGKVRPAKALSLKEIKNVYAEILKQ